MGHVGDVRGPKDLEEPLEDALAGVDDALAVVSSVYDLLLGKGLVYETKAEAPANATVENVTRPVAGLSRKKFESIFSKELKKRDRAAECEVSAEALACLHCWDNTGAGGVRCQVCTFETKER